MGVNLSCSEFAMVTKRILSYIGGMTKKIGENVYWQKANKQSLHLKTNFKTDRVVQAK